VKGYVRMGLKQAADVAVVVFLTLLVFQAGWSHRWWAWFAVGLVGVVAASSDAEGWLKLRDRRAGRQT
jgi:hypothetical protein